MITWNSDSPVFKQLIDEVKPRKIIEIGSWHGGSAVRMSHLAPEAEIICIDTWLGASEFYTIGGPERDLQLVDGYPTVYKTFKENTREYPNIRSIPLPSHEARHLCDDVDLIYIDGSHDFDAVYQDLKDYYPKAPVLFGDDYGNKDFEVKQAVDQFCLERNAPLEILEDWFWVIRK